MALPMSDNKPLANRIPFESITQLDKWPLPRMGEDGKVIPASTKAASTHAEAATQPAGMRDKERIEDVSEPVEHKPLTAEQLNQITEEAEQEGYKAGLEKGYAEGMEKGRVKGEEQGHKQAYDETKAGLEAEKARWQSLCAALLEPLEEQDQAIENAIVDIAMGVAKHILGQELQSRPAALYTVVEQAVAAMPMGAKALRISLNPDDVVLAEELFAGNGKAWTFAGDARLARGGCRVESTESLVDFSVEKRLQEYLTTVREKSVNKGYIQPVVDQRPPAEEQEKPAQAPADINSAAQDSAITDNAPREAVRDEDPSCE